MWARWTGGGLGIIFCVSVLLAGVSGEELDMHYCTQQGCASRVEVVFCKEENLKVQPPFKNCTGRPELHEVCQYKGHLFAATHKNVACEFESNTSMLSSSCKGDDPPCDFMNAPPLSDNSHGSFSADLLTAPPVTPPPRDNSPETLTNVEKAVIGVSAVILVPLLLGLGYVLWKKCIRPRFDCFQDRQQGGVISEDIQMLPLQTSSSSRDAQNSPSSAPPPSSPLIPTKTSPEQDEHPHQERRPGDV